MVAVSCHCHQRDRALRYNRIALDHHHHACAHADREPHLSVEESFSKLMGTAGLSVLVTLMASILAFALGTSDDLNSVKWFSGFATLNAVRKALCSQKQ
jgi:hypothetical protein